MINKAELIFGVQLSLNEYFNYREARIFSPPVLQCDGSSIASKVCIKVS